MSIEDYEFVHKHRYLGKLQKRLYLSTSKWCHQDKSSDEVKSINRGYLTYIHHLLSTHDFIRVAKRSRCAFEVNVASDRPFGSYRLDEPAIEAVL